MAGSRLSCSWLKDETQAESLADFFVNNVDTSYISYGEITTGRAIDDHTWSPTLRALIAQEIRECARRPTPTPNLRVGVASDGEITIALAIVRVEPGAIVPHAWIEDMVVADASRGHGAGAQFLSWIEAQLESESISVVFLESGLANTEAHKFFQNKNYTICSYVMSKKLTTAPSLVR